MKKIITSRVLGQCPVCMQMRRVRIDGKLHNHPPGSIQCPGSGQHPVGLKKDPDAKS